MKEWTITKDDMNMSEFDQFSYKGLFDIRRGDRNIIRKKFGTIEKMNEYFETLYQYVKKNIIERLTIFREWQIKSFKLESIESRYIKVLNSLFGYFQQHLILYNEDNATKTEMFTKLRVLYWTHDFNIENKMKKWFNEIHK